MASDTSPSRKEGDDGTASDGEKVYGKNVKGAGKDANKTSSFAPASGQPTCGGAGGTANGSASALIGTDPAASVSGGSTEGNTNGTAAASGDASEAAAPCREAGDGPEGVTDEEKMAMAKAGYKRLCSDATLQNKKDGYFNTYDSQVSMR